MQSERNPGDQTLPLTHSEVRRGLSRTVWLEIKSEVGDETNTTRDVVSSLFGFGGKIDVIIPC